MVQRTQIILEDDVDGGPADETVAFGLDGATYEIDLAAQNAASFRKALAPFVAAGRRSGGRRSVRGKGRSSTGTQQLREWARSNGYQVKDRGQISAEIKEAYDKAAAR